MKTFNFQMIGRVKWRISAFTLPEMMIGVGIFSMVIAAVVSTQIFGLRTYTLSATKLAASDSAREVLNKIRTQIRSAKTLYVGNCTTNGATSFTLISAPNAQVGNALKIYPATNQDNYIIYYLATGSTNYLKQYTFTNNTGVIDTLASYITNTTVFYAEDYQGNTLSNNQNNRVIKMWLQFYQWEYPIARVVGGNATNYYNAYNNYQLRTRVVQRAID